MLDPQPCSVSVVHFFFLRPNKAPTFSADPLFRPSVSIRATFSYYNSWVSQGNVNFGAAMGATMGTATVGPTYDHVAAMIIAEKWRQLYIIRNRKYKRGFIQIARHLIIHPGPTTQLEAEAEADEEVEHYPLWR